MNNKQNLPKRQHFISQFYLNIFFSGKSNKGKPIINIYDKKLDKHTVDVIENVGQIHNFYNINIPYDNLTSKGKDIFDDENNVHHKNDLLIATIEHYLADIEDKISPIYYKLISSGDLNYLTNEERNKISALVALIWLRNPLCLKKHNMLFTYKIKKQRLLAGVTKHKINQSDYEKFSWSSSFIHLLDDESRLFFNRRWTILQISPFEHRLLTSDNPIVFVNKNQKSYGPKTPGTVTYFPLSPYLLLKINFEDDTSNFCHNNTTIIHSNDVDYFNDLQYENASRFIYSSFEYKK